MPVQADAFAAKSARVDPAAQIAGNAKILHSARIAGQARVYDRAIVAHNAAVLAGDGQLGAVFVHGTAEIDGHAVVGLGADIAARWHVLTVSGIGPDRQTLTAYRKHPLRDEEGIWSWSHGVFHAGWFGDLDGLVDRADSGELDWPGDLLDELDAAIDLVAERIRQWRLEPVANEDRKRWQLRDSDLRRTGKRAEAAARRAAGIPFPQPRPRRTPSAP